MAESVGGGWVGCLFTLGVGGRCCKETTQHGDRTLPHVFAQVSHSTGRVAPKNWEIDTFPDANDLPPTASELEGDDKCSGFVAVMKPEW